MNSIRLTNYSKYKNTRTRLFNIDFDSKAESERYLHLLDLVKRKKIAHLELQPKYLLQDGFIDNMGCPHKPIYYIADFSYLDLSGLHVEDVKSQPTKTKDYLLKKKLFLYKYPDILFNEV